MFTGSGLLPVLELLPALRPLPLDGHLCRRKIPSSCSQLGMSSWKWCGIEVRSGPNTVRLVPSLNGKPPCVQFNQQHSFHLVQTFQAISTKYICISLLRWIDNICLGFFLLVNVTGWCRIEFFFSTNTLSTAAGHFSTRYVKLPMARTILILTRKLVILFFIAWDWLNQPDEALSCR